MSKVDVSTRKATDAFLKGLDGRFPVRSAMLFGSRARQDHALSSDADVAIVLEGEQGAFADTKLAMADIAFDVMLETGILIQPLPIWESEWQHPEHYPNPELLANIRREGIRL
jgi:predicted nucleotidyltransferase